MNSEIEKLKERLIDDLESHPSSLLDPIGDARTYRKILDYIFMCVKEGREKAEIADWLYDLYKEQNDEEKHLFSSRIDLVVEVLIKYNSYLNG